ncbi:putative flavanone 3-dioxygenase [Rosa chinensis]|uniref:Putative flavanone 3-dioxygenase n=1 Tax=Rosa chinensis TaxID=74649 RepID=A0A2P6P913_ROSCH|nr:2-oxoglutarate-dependent dioxygenase 19 [Rosa chinensis]PRQ18397.1 putative flavanone 3-dioxygenase [Rosa chinensis]
MAAVARALETSNVTSIKSLVESPTLSSVPSAYAFNINPNDEADPNDPEFAIPIVDMSLLTSGSPDQRTQIVHDLVKICEEWGFFIAINHGVQESLMKGMIEAYHGFFSLPDEEKEEFKFGNDVLEMFNYGTSYNLALDKVLLWRDFFKVRTHPEFHSHYKPASFSEISLEFSKRSREVALEITRAISESLGLQPDYIYNTMNMDRGLQMLAGNYYPPCPQPQNAIGIPHHTDPGLVTLVIQNEMNGLQVEHNGKWLTVNGPPNGFFVNLADQMQILTNGKYKSVMHRATVNNKATRISIAIPHGPSIDTIIAPAPELCEREGQAPKYHAMNYKEYMQLVQSGKNYMKATLDHIRA